MLSGVGEGPLGKVSEDLLDRTVRNLAAGDHALTATYTATPQGPAEGRPDLDGGVSSRLTVLGGIPAAAESFDQLDTGAKL